MKCDASVSFVLQLPSQPVLSTARPVAHVSSVTIEMPS